jgi:hypothetical protein
MPAISIAPVRGLLCVFAATEYDTVPRPLPGEPAVIETNSASVVAVQAQPTGAFTVTIAAPPDAGNDFADSVSENRQGVAAPACVTRTTWSATVIVAVRAAAPVFAAIWNVKDPLPETCAVFTVSHGWLDTGLHVQSLSVVPTITVPLNPAAGAEIEFGETPNWHPTASWFTVNVRPAMVTVPVRGAPV